MDVLPISMLEPQNVRWRRTLVTTKAPPSLSQIEQRVLNDGGGKWLCDMSIPLLRHNSPDTNAIKLARAIVEMTDDGTIPILVPFVSQVWEGPWPDGIMPSTVPHSDGTPFSDDTEYLSGSIEVYTAGAVALRATEVTLDPVVIGNITGGEMFSVNYPTKGHHIHAIGRINGNVAKIRPPWREATSSPVVLNMSDPMCAMRLLNASEAIEAIRPPYVSTLNVQFVEAF